VRIGLCRGGCAREGSAERGNDWSFLPVHKLRSKGDVPRAGYPTFNLISGLQRRVWTARRGGTLSHPILGPSSPRPPATGYENNPADVVKGTTLRADLEPEELSLGFSRLMI